MKRVTIALKSGAVIHATVADVGFRKNIGGRDVMHWTDAEHSGILLIEESDISAITWETVA